MLCTNKEQTKTIRLPLLEAMVPDGIVPLMGYRYDPVPQLLIAITLLLFQQLLLQELSTDVHLHYS